jgi:hypothetical protein
LTGNYPVSQFDPSGVVNRHRKYCAIPESDDLNFNRFLLLGSQDLTSITDRDLWAIRLNDQSIRIPYSPDNWEGIDAVKLLEVFSQVDHVSKL